MKNNQIDSFRDKVHVVLMLYTLGLLMWIGFILLRMLGRVRILYQERLPKKPNRLLVVANHPNLGEAVLLVFLFARDFFLNPFQATPWSTPDENNYNKGVWKLFKPRLIFIDRKDKEKAMKGFNKIVKVLSLGMIVILFPEAGRTDINQPYKKKSFFFSKNGRRFREFKEGAAFLILKTNPSVLPVCVNGTANRTKKLYTLPRIENIVTIKIGKVVNFEGYKSERKITQKLESIFAELADE